MEHLLVFLFQVSGQYYVDAALVTGAAGLILGVFNTTFGAILKGRYDSKILQEKTGIEQDVRRQAVFEIIRDKKIQDGNAAAEVLRRSGQTLISQLELLASDTGSLSDTEIVKTMEVTLKNYGLFRSQLDEMESDLPNDERVDLEDIEKLAVTVILDVARVQSDRIKRLDKMRVHLEPLKYAHENIDKILSNWIPPVYRALPIVVQEKNA